MIIIIIRMKIGCVNIRTSDQVKKKFSYVEMPVWYRLLICVSEKGVEKPLVSTYTMVYKLYRPNDMWCTSSL